MNTKKNPVSADAPAGHPEDTKETFNGAQAFSILLFALMVCGIAIALITR